MEVKNKKLKQMHFTEFHQNFEEYDNIILDKIVTINILGVEKYPKLYDVTVPSTLNFGISNGLICRDTSETGYLNRGRKADGM